VAVHALLEWSARNGWRDPGEERATAALREQGLEGSSRETARALELAGAWLGSPLREEIAAGDASAEVPFVLSVGGAPIRGSIDLLVERADGTVLVVDYKTDRLQGRDPLETAARYSVQRDLYALAAAARGAPVETAYVFLEQPDTPARQLFETPDLEAARARVETLLEELAAGSFDVTDRPHAALCHDCPARDRLCRHSLEMTMRDSSDDPAAAAPGAEQMSLLDGG
jgi:hypothetical protein